VRGAAGVLVGAAMSACLPAPCARLLVRPQARSQQRLVVEGAGAARDEGDGQTASQPETKRKQRRANTGTARARSSCAPPFPWGVYARAPHFLLFFAVFFFFFFFFFACGLFFRFRAIS
jgi:hypothetical protein